MLKPDARSLNTNPIISREAYRIFVCFIFGAGMTFWGNTLIKSEPLRLFNEAPRIIISGLIYGAVLVCIFWIYLEILTNEFIPNNLVTLFIDFVALSFMAGAARKWNEEKTFLVLASFTIGFLAFRLFRAVHRETRKMELTLFHGWWVMLWQWKFLAHITMVFVIYFFVYAPWLCALLFWELLIVELDTMSQLLNFGMLLGVGLTIGFSLKHIIPPEEKAENIGIIDESTLPSLIPAYGEVQKGKISDIAACIFKGQALFRKYLDNSQLKDFPRFPYHLSHVHSYRDVETQAFIMAHHGQTDKEIELRSMWVYLAHWFDDIFDNYYPVKIAFAIESEEFKSSSDITALFAGLNPVIRTLWDSALEDTKKSGCCKKENLLVLGIQRLAFGGPIFSNLCIKKEEKFLEDHRILVIENIDNTHGVKSFIEEYKSLYGQKAINRYLAYTTKVVVEIWDSFAEDSDFELSMLMNFFYAPGLYHHDFEMEHKYGEKPLTVIKNMIVEPEILNKVMILIKGLDKRKLNLAVKPVPLFIRSFAPILKDIKLLEIYEKFIQDSTIKQALEQRN